MLDDEPPYDTRSRCSATSGASRHVLTNPLFVKMITSFQGGLPKALYEFAQRSYPDWDFISSNHRHQRVRLLGIEVLRRGDMALLQLAAGVQYHEAVGRQIVARRIALPLQYAIENHRPEMLCWIYTHNLDPHARAEDMWHDAVTHFCGDFAILEALKILLVNTNAIATEDTVLPASVAFRLLDIRLLRWLHENVPTVKIPTGRLMSEATDAGKLDIVQYLHAYYRAHVYRSDMYVRAWTSGALDVLEFLLRYRSEPCSDQFLERIVKDGSVQVLEMVQRLRGLSPHDHSDGATEILLAQRPVATTKCHALGVIAP